MTYFTGKHKQPNFQTIFVNDFKQQCIVNHINTLRPKQNGRHFADDSFMRIFLKENVRISIKISLNFVTKSPIDNIPALFQIMAWRRPGDKPLSEAMIVSLLTHICVARPQWVNQVWIDIQYNNYCVVKQRHPSYKKETRFKLHVSTLLFPCSYHDIIRDQRT